MFSLRIEAATIEELRSKALNFTSQFTGDRANETTPVSHEAITPVNKEPAIKAKPGRKPSVKQTITKEQVHEESKIEVKSESQEIVKESSEEETAQKKKIVTESLQGVQKRKGFDEMRLFLAQFQSVANKPCQRLSELQEKDYDDFILAAEALE